MPHLKASDASWGMGAVLHGELRTDPWAPVFLANLPELFEEQWPSTDSDTCVHMRPYGQRDLTLRV